MEPHRRVSPEIVVLGIVTITSYGSWMYGYGVMIDSIRADTGWSTTMLGTTYGVAQAITASGALFGGRLIDRVGGIGPFSVQATLGAGLLLVATWMTSPWAFLVVYSAGAGVTGATGFYHVTTVLAARAEPDRPDKAIAALTIIGAFASPIYVPIAAWLLETWHWRSVARLLAASCLAGALLGIVFASGGRSETGGPSPNPVRAVREAMAHRNTRRMLLSFLTAWFAFTSVIVYQVPILTTTGLTLATAGWVAGLRGLSQTLGRVGLIGMVDRFGSGRLLVAAYTLAAVGMAFLLPGGLGPGVVFAVVAGAALGSTSPLQAIHARKRFEGSDLGLLMGLQGTVAGIAGACAPILAAVMHDASQSWLPTILLSIVGLIASAVLIREPPGSLED